MAILIGVSFTLSFFIVTLAYEDLNSINAICLGVMTGSLLLSVTICLVLYLSKPKAFLRITAGAKPRVCTAIAYSMRFFILTSRAGINLTT